MIAIIFLTLLGIYFACGVVFAVPFVLWGAKAVDSRATHGTWGFRLLIIPGVTAFWPLLMHRWLRHISEPPEESTAHRELARAQKLTWP